MPERIDGIETKSKRFSKSAYKRSTENISLQNRQEKFRSSQHINRKPGIFLKDNDL